VTTAYVGLGSNVGDRLENIRDALRLLDERTEVVGMSTVYETEPVGPPQPDFLNAVCRIETGLSPHELLDVLKSIEVEIGRSPGERWGPREIDLDLLLYGDEETVADDLMVPHPRLTERAFVLVPLLEIAPEVSLPDGTRVSSFVRGHQSLKPFASLHA
jgi:2-amino-4-hydroxy-6-hydroxymethyldihydropteridine diphosphokinase